MRVAFIDDQVNSSIIRECSNVKHIKNLVYDHDRFVRRNVKIYGLSHSTLCCKIFCDCLSLSNEIELVFLDILDNKTLKGNIKLLIKAITWCIQNKIDLINLSLGTTDWNDYISLKRCIDYASKNNVVVVSALSNKGFMTFPAFFSNTISVVSKNQKNKTFGSGVSDISCLVEEKKIVYDGFVKVIKNYNSYAAPIVSARVYQYMLNGIRDVCKLKKMLKSEFDEIGSYGKQNYEYQKPIIYYAHNKIEDIEYIKENIRKIIIFFKDKGYEGGCVSDILCTDMTMFTINCKEFKDINVSTKDFFPFLTNYLDVDFIILNYIESRINFDIMKNINILISDNNNLRDCWSNTKTYKMKTKTNKKKLNRMLKVLR